MYVDRGMSLSDPWLCAMFLLAPCGSRRREFPEELWSIIELYDAAAVTRLEVHVSYKFPLDAQHPCHGYGACSLLPSYWK